MRPDLAQYAEFCWHAVAATGEEASGKAKSEEIASVCRPYLERVSEEAKVED